MEIYVLRHGIAEEGAPGGRDSDRALTAEGKRKTREVMAVASRAGVEPTLIMTSPYVRAVGTAEIAADVLSYKDSLLRTAALTPDSEPSAVWDEIRAHKSEKSVLLASHEPLCSRLVAHLLGAAIQVDMKKSALVRIDVDQFGAQPRGVLRWMLVPRLVG